MNLEERQALSKKARRDFKFDPVKPFTDLATGPDEARALNLS